jgi:hypothetical protein
MLTEAYGILLCHAPFARPLKRALLARLWDYLPELGRKLNCLTAAPFEAACQEIKQVLQRAA